MDELLGAVDGVAADDLSPLFGPAGLDRLRSLLVVQNRLAAGVAERGPLALAAEQGVDVAAVGAVLTDVATERPHADVAKAVHHYLDRLDQDGPEPDPTEGRRLATVKHADGSISGRFDPMRWAGRSCRRRWSRSCRPVALPGTNGPAPSSWPMHWCRCVTTPWPPAS